MMRALWFAAALSAPLPALAQGNDVEAAFAGIPDVSIEYYDVGGTSAEAISAAMRAQGLRDTADGKVVDALSHWTMEWYWPGDDRGGCDLANATIDFAATVKLPRLTGTAAVPEPVLARWRAFSAALAAHEAGHIRYGYERIADVKAAIAASDCEGANDAATAVVKAVSLRDIEYDRVTRHGETQGAVFP